MPGGERGKVRHQRADAVVRRQHHQAARRAKAAGKRGHAAGEVLVGQDAAAGQDGGPVSMARKVGGKGHPGEF